MPAWEAEVQRQRPPNAVSLRTLRQRPKAAGSTADGMPSSRSAPSGSCCGARPHCNRLGAVGHAAEETAALTGACSDLAVVHAELAARLDALAPAVESADGAHAVEQRILEELYRVNVRLVRLQPRPARAARPWA